MKKQLYLLSFLILLLISNAFIQTEDISCPPLFTHERTINSEISIVNMEVIDSNKYETLPKFKGNIDNVSKKIVYPEIAKRAGLEGIVKLLITIDSTGKAINSEFLNALGAGTEYAALDIILKEKYYPAVLNNKKVSSQLVIDINFNLNLIVDMPDIVIDEIKLESFGGQIFHIKRIIFLCDGSASFSEDWGTEPPKKYIGKIEPYLFTKLNDFIISQCFFDLLDEYLWDNITHGGYTIITVRSSNEEKSVTSKGKFEPIALWAISTIILQVKDQIKWEEVSE